VILIASLAFCKLVYNKRHSASLRSLPGPTVAAYTKYWRLYNVYQGSAHKTAIALHRKHGPLVRIAPNVVSVADPRAIPVIYGASEKFTKTGFYPIQCVSWQKSTAHNLFSTRDPAFHREQKRLIAAAYSMSNLLQAEDRVDSCTQLFMARLAERAGKPMDLGAWLQYYAFDVVGEFTFAKKLGFLEQGEDVDGMMKAIEGMLAYASLCGQVPEWHARLLGNPLLTRFAPAMETWNQTLLFTLKAINSRTEVERDEEIANADDKGVDMLSRFRAVKAR